MYVLLKLVPLTSVFLLHENTSDSEMMKDSIQTSPTVTSLT